MGIRYFALAVPPHRVDEAAASVRNFVDSRPWDEVRERGEEPISLDLDKSWRYLQVIFGPRDSPSPAYELVRGAVTHTDAGGWIPFERFLTPDEVGTIARDLADTDECRVMDALAADSSRSLADFEQDVDYALHYVSAAISFTQTLVESGSGLVYWIG